MKANKQQILVTFSNHQKWELQGLTGLVDAPTNSKLSLSKNAGEQLKEEIIQYCKESKRMLQEKNGALDWIKDFFIQKKLCAKEYSKQGKLAGSDMSKEEIYECMKKLRALLSEKERDSQCYNIYVTILSDLLDLNKDKLASFEELISKSYKVMSFVERDNISKIAHRLVDAQFLSKKAKSLQEVSIMFSKILRYGLSQQFQQLQRIEDEQMKSKSLTLMQYLKNNCIEMDSMYNRQNSIKQFISRLSNSLYTKQQIIKKLKSLNAKVQGIFQPLVSEIFLLRQYSGQKNRRYSQNVGDRFSVAQSRLVEQESINKMITEMSALRKKNEELQSKLNDLKVMTSTLTAYSGNQSEKSDGQLIAALAKYKQSQFGEPFNKIYQQQKELRALSQKIEKLSEKRVSNEENVQFSKILKLKEELRKSKQQNEVLSQKNYETIEQRIQMLNRIEKLEGNLSQKQSSQNDELIKLNQKLQEKSREIKELAEKCSKYEYSIESLNKYNRQLSLQLENYKEEVEKLREQKILYEKTLSELQKQKANEVSMKTEAGQEQDQEKMQKQRELALKMEEYQRRIEEKDFMIKSLVNEKNQQCSLIQETQSQIVKIKQLKEIEIKALRYQLSEMEKQTANEETNQLQMQILQLATKNEQLAGEIQELIQAKENAQEMSRSLHKINKQSEKENKELKKSIGNLHQKETELKEENNNLQKELEEIKNEIIQLVDKYEIALAKISIMEARQKQMESQNCSLRSEIKELRDSSFQQSSKSFITNQEYMSMKSSFEELQKFTSLIKDEYTKYRSEMRNMLKSKIEQEAQHFMQAENKLKENYKRLHDNFQAQKLKLQALKKENQSMKETNSRRESIDSSNNFGGVSLEGQLRTRELKKQIDALRKENQRLRHEKQADMACQKLTILKLEKQLLTMHDKPTQPLRYQQRERFQQLEREDTQNQKIIYQLKVELEKKEHQNLRLKSQMFPIGY